MNQLNLIQDFVDTLPDAMLFIDEQGCVTWWNRAAQKLLRLYNDRHQNAVVEDIIAIPSIRDFCLNDKGEVFEARLPQRVETRVAFSTMDYQQQRILCLRDITHLHRLEQMRQDFVANVSHELRTPLTVVHGYLEYLLEDDKTPAATQREILGKIYQQSERMHKLIEDLLFLATLDVDLPQDNVEVVNVPFLLKAIHEEAKILSGKRNHQFHLEIDDSLLFHGHEKELRGAFANLVYNAVNYTPANEHIYINWYASDDGIHFSVRDTGQGIEAKHIPRLTERFYRVDKARSRDSGGTGLGLAIVKHVFIRHDGRFDINSEVGQGSTFSCSFPLKWRA